MIELKFIRENPDAVRKASADKGIPCDLDKILTLDAEVRRLNTETQEVAALRNIANQAVPQIKSKPPRGSEPIHQLRLQALASSLEDGAKALRSISRQSEMLRDVAGTARRMNSSNSADIAKAVEDAARSDPLTAEAQMVRDAARVARNMRSTSMADIAQSFEEAAQFSISTTVGSQISALVKAIREIDLTSAQTQLKNIANLLKQEEDRLHAKERQLDALLLTVPNVPHSSVPIGKTPADNQVFSTWGEPPKFDFTPKPHWELASKLGIIDFERGAKIAGSGFPVYLGLGAKLERGLIQFFLDLASRDGGYTEMSPPIVINEASARGTGQIPDKEDLMYVVERDGLFLAPTAEVPVTNFYRDEILDEKQLPIKFCAYTPCFRREAGSYGKDVKGLNRLHQFDKVELVKFVHPEKSYDELESLREDAERPLRLLGLPYRVLLMCTGDMGFTQTKKYDLEVWAAGQQKWLEVSSCSNFESFQARRMNIRFRSSATGKMQNVHTLNGSGLALPRIVAALLENYQTADGHIQIPQVLQPYLGVSKIVDESL